MPPHPLSSGLLAAKAAGKLVPLVGAGLSLGSDIHGNFPKWLDLPARLLAECDNFPHVWNNDNDRETLRRRFLDQGPIPLETLLRELDILKHKLGVHYRDALTAIFRPADASPGATHRALAELAPRILLTTNYDRLLEDAERPSRPVYTWRQADQALADIKSGRRVLFKIHGTAEDESSIVLTQDEYTTAHNNPSYRKVMDYLLLDNSLLFVGYGMSDPQDLDHFLAEQAEQLRHSASIHYALLKRLGDPQTEVDRQARLRNQRISVIPFDDHADLAPLLAQIARA